MAFKVLLVQAEGTGPGKKNLAQVISEEVASVESKEKADIKDLKIEADMRSGGYGQAIVTVFYDKKK
jgi:hypothetical protein